MGLIPPFYFDCVVAIGLHNSEGKFKGIASGFLYGDYLDSKEEGKIYRIYLVTNRHVFDGLKQVYLRFNPAKMDEPAHDYNLRLLDKKGEPLWWAHPKNEIDVAVTGININLLKEHAMQVNYFLSDEHVANTQKLDNLGIMEGDFVYVLGFPMGIVGERRNVVIARSGTIARIKDAIAKDNPEFLIDAFVFPGNSGGPVVSKPEVTRIKGTKSQNASYLIGLVSSYVTYEDVAISKQTRKTRIIFEENSGLAIVHPIDYVQETIARDIRKKKKRKKRKKKKS